MAILFKMKTMDLGDWTDFYYTYAETAEEAQAKFDRRLTNLFQLQMSRAKTSYLATVTGLVDGVHRDLQCWVNGLDEDEATLSASKLFKRNFGAFKRGAKRCEVSVTDVLLEPQQQTFGHNNCYLVA